MGRDGGEGKGVRRAAPTTAAASRRLRCMHLHQVAACSTAGNAPHAVEVSHVCLPDPICGFPPLQALAPQPSFAAAAADAVQGSVSQQRAAELQRILEERGAKLPDLRSSPQVCGWHRNAARIARATVVQSAQSVAVGRLG